MSTLDYFQSFLLTPFLLFLAIFLIQKSVTFDWMAKLASNLNRRGLFSTVHNQGDQVILNLARIFVGLILLYRVYYIGVFLLPLHPASIQLTALVCYLILCITLTLGLLAPLSALLLLLFQLQFNFALGTYTLGVDVTAMLLLCFVLYPVGQMLSLDALAANRWTWITRFYAWFSISDRNTQVTIAKALSFFSYYLLCLYSVFMHIDEPLWMNGEVSIHLLSSSYLSQHHSLFQWLFANSPWAVLTAKLAMLGMIAWYFLLAPAVVFGGIARVLAILWALLFFLISTFVLQLSALPYIEFMLLFIWFWDLLKTKNSGPVNALYDDRCNLCDRTVRVLRMLDVFQVLNFLPVSSNMNKAEMVGVESEELYKNLYSWESNSGKIHSGYGFYLHICRRLVLLMPLYPILWMFKILLIGPALYRIVANYRIRWFGVCKIPTNFNVPYSSPLASGKTATALVGQSRGFFRPFVVTSLSFAFLFILILPVSPFRLSLTNTWPDLIRSAHILSWTRINVFNRSDIGLSHQYFAVSALDKRSERLLPFTDIEGARLSWHRSDRVYFGNSLKWRRVKNKQSIVPITATDKRWFCELIVWAGDRGIEGPDGYRFDFYQSDQPVAVQGQGVYKFDPPRKVHSIVIAEDDCAR